MSGASRIERWKRAVSSHPFAMDVGVAATLCGAALIDNAANAWHGGGTVSSAAVLTTMAAAYGALLCRRRWPVTALAVTVAAAEVYMTLSSLHWWIVPAPLIALYHLAVTTDDRRRLLVAGGLTALVLGGVPALVLSHAWWDTSWLREPNLSVTVACALALATGDASRSRRAYLAEVVERARRAELGRELEARRRVVEERLRIARELHDSMGHHLAVINAQGGLATHVFDDQPATARDALTMIKQASRAALDELRNTVGLLRQPGEPDLPTQPTVGIGGIDDLVASLRGSGMRIDQQVEGSIRQLPPATGLTAYRVVQEALTNVGKHAAGALARVRLCYEPTALRIVVDDDGTDRGDQRGETRPQLAADRAGHGLHGMRERVQAIGGSLAAGPRPSGGFRISAVLPLPTGDRT